MKFRDMFLAWLIGCVLALLLVEAWDRTHALPEDPEISEAAASVSNLSK